jgi:general secretion pathway protein D
MHKKNYQPRTIFSASLALVLLTSHLTLTLEAEAQSAKKSKTPYQSNPFREGEVLGPDSSTEPLPVELVEDPALGGKDALKARKLKKNSQDSKSTNSDAPQNNKELGDKEILRDLTAKISDNEESNAISDTEATTTLNAKDVEIATLVKSFSKIAKRNYIVDSNVKGKVTIHLAEGVSTGEALRILDSVLLLKGFTAVPIGPNTYKVIQAKDAKKTTIPTMDINGDSSGVHIDTTSDALVTQLIRLKNVQATDLQGTIQQFVSPDGLLTTFQGTNSIIVIDSAANIERIANVVKQLDVPALDQDVTVIPVKFAQAKDIAEKINQILGQGDDKGQGGAAGKANLRLPPPINMQNGAIGGAPPPQAGLTNASLESGSGRKALPAKVLADERTNSIVVVADPDTTKKVQALVEQLDSKVDQSGGKFYVARLKHADAEDLSDVLNAVLGGGGNSGGSRRDSGTSGSSLNRRNSGNSGGAGGFGGNGGGFGGGNGGGRGRFGGGSSNSGIGGQGNSGGGGGFTVGAGQQGSRLNFEGDVSIASDPTTNSIIISATKNDYLKVKEVIDILDIRRKQVLVETTILEVSLNQNKELGFDLVGSAATDKAGVIVQNNTGGGLAKLLSSPQDLSNLTIAAASSGSISLPGITIPSQALILRAVQTNQNVNVLSTPTLLTTDNQEAEIVVGNNIPIVTSQATNATNLGNTFNNIERQDVGITLRLTPQIGAGDFVTMRIFVEISNVVERTSADTNGPTTSVRTSETNVEVKSGQMVVTGGLIQDQVEENESGVPYWSDIPVLGNLFSTDRKTRRRTNLLIFITPRILADQFDAREVTVEGRDKLTSVIENQIETTNVETPDRKEVLHHESIDRVFEKGTTTEEKPSTITPPKVLSSEEEKAIRASIKEFSLKETQPTPFLVSVSPKGKIAEVTPGASLASKAPSKVEGESSFGVVLRSLDSSAELIGLEIPGTPNGTAGMFFQTGSKVKRSVNGKIVEYICLGRHESVLAAMKSPLHPQTWQKFSLEESLQLGSGEWTK